MTTPSERRHPLRLRVAVGLLLGLGAWVTAFWFTRNHGGPILRERLGRVGLLLLLLATLTLLNLGLRWLRWHFLTRRLEVMLRAKESFRLYFATLLAFATPFYAGELVRGVLLARRYPALRPAVLPIWLVERGSDAAALALFWAWSGGHGALALLAAAGLLLLALVFAPTRQQLKDPRPVGWPSHVALVAALPVLTIAAWSLPILGLSVILRALGGAASLRTAALAFSQGTLLGALTGLPLGTGVSGSATLVSLTGAGVAADTATASVALLRAGTSWFAAGLGTLVLARSWPFLASLRREHQGPTHFDALAPRYAEQIPAHLRDRLLLRKVAFMQRHLEEAGLRRGSLGLDLGCGQGSYLSELSAQGYVMVGADAALEQLREARGVLEERATAPCLVAADGRHLPFASGTFDFAYSINTFHHLGDRAEQRSAFREVVRVLKPGGTLFLHEINVENPLFRFYMSYVFPLVKAIDEGNECWLRVSSLPEVEGARWRSPVEYFTFTPDFLPSALLRVCAPIEHRIERSFLRVYAAHYLARLQKHTEAESHA